MTITKKILFVFTGGTIGSLADQGSINVHSSAHYLLLAQFQQRFRQFEAVEFKIVQPLSLLSENLVPEDWCTLISAINKEQPEHYAGVIITHGTDTLSFTAALLSLYFHRLSVPILLVSIDFPLTDARANGLGNFVCAVDFINQRVIDHGVFVPYRNAGQAQLVHRGNRLTASLPLGSDFIGIQNQSYLHYADGIFTPSHTSLKLQPHPRQSFNLMANFSQRIVLVRPYPGLNYQLFNLEGVGCVLHDLYHSGTACASPNSEQERYGLPAFLTRCRNQQIPVYLAPAIYSDNAYQSTLSLIDLGATVLWNLTLEVAYGKLLLAYGNFDSAGILADFLAANLADEQILTQCLTLHYLI